MLVVHPVWVGNPLRNICYVVACTETKQAVLVDPIAPEKCLALVAAHKLHVVGVLNTHEHHDHIDGNKAIVHACGVSVSAYHLAPIPHIRGLRDQDIVPVGTSRLTVMHTPGHTAHHICFLGVTRDGPFILGGDTMFCAGVGNCIHGGNVDELFETFETKIAELPGNTRLYPGHDYMMRNLAFALSVERELPKALELQQRYSHCVWVEHTPTLDEEREYNVFLRLHQRSVFEGVEVRLRQHKLAMPADSRRNVFCALRELRNRW